MQNNLFKIFILLLTFIFLSHVYSGDSLKVHTPGIWDDIVNDTKVFFADGAAFYTTPLRLNSKEWLYTGAGFIGFGVIMSQDKNLNKSFSKGEHTGDFWSIVKNYGDVKYAALGSGAIYFTGLLSRSKRIRETGRMLIQSLAYSGILTTLLKMTTGRSRPNITDDQYDFNWFETVEEKQSFPSGHATVSFAVSTVLAERINTWWSRTFFYTLAALTTYSRVHDNQHWVSDAVLGGLIGFGSGYFVVHHNEIRKNGSKFSFSPSINGISVQYKF